MRVLLVQSWLGREQHPVVPLGLAQIAGALKGHSIRIIDPNVHQDPLGSIREAALEFKPDTAGFSLRNCDTTSYNDRFSYMPAFREQTALLRRELPGTHIIAGGAGFSIFPEEIMEHCSAVDCGVTGHGEAIVSGIVETRAEGIHSGQGGTLLQPRLDLLDLGAYSTYQFNLSAGIEVNRGCGERCSYCSYRTISGNSVMERQTQSIVDDIRYHIERGISHFFLIAPLLNSTRTRGEKVARALISSCPGISWEAYHTARDFDANYASLIAASGCAGVAFSPDGGTALQMELNGKEYTPDQLKKAVEAASNAGLSVSINVFPWHAKTGITGMLQAFRNGNRWGRTAGQGLRRLRFGLVRRMPGTAYAPASVNMGVDQFDKPPAWGMPVYLVLKRLYERGNAR